MTDTIIPEPGRPNNDGDGGLTDAAIKGKPDVNQTETEGFSLALRLLQMDRHPILIFGASASGKSTLLMSLLQSLRGNQRISCSLGAPILPISHPNHAAVHAEADNFYYGELDPTKRDGRVPDATLLDEPLFIPVDIAIDGKTVAKLAFLEGKGEWYEPIREGRRITYPSLGADIIDLIKHYSRGISIIYVAPFTEDVPGDPDIERCGRGLVGVMQFYSQHRLTKAWDFHLFLLTKWDRLVRPLDNPDSLTDVDSDLVKAELGRKYDDAWQTFRTLPLSGPSVRRFFMQYCSGLIVNATLQRPHDWFGDDFDRYPKTLLNWIFENATQVSERSDGNRYHHRKALFPEVAQPKGVRFPLVKRIRDFVFLD